VLYIGILSSPIILAFDFPSFPSISCSFFFLLVLVGSYIFIVPHINYAPLHIILFSMPSRKWTLFFWPLVAVKVYIYIYILFFKFYF